MEIKDDGFWQRGVWRVHRARGGAELPVLPGTQGLARDKMMQCSV